MFRRRYALSQCALIYNQKEDFASQAEILSRPLCGCLATTLRACGCQAIYIAGEPCPACDGAEWIETDFSGTPSVFSTLSGFDTALVFFESLPALTRATVGKLLAAGTALLADEHHEPLALCAPLAVVQRLSGNRSTLVEELRGLGPLLTEVSLAEEDGSVVRNGLDLYHCQELLRRRINQAHMEAGVTLVDPATTHISPDALVEAGALIMPGCFIYGRSHVEAMAKVGPNAMIVDSVIGCGASVNASQVIESVVGAQTTVGPYAYIRPGCDVGEKVRVGDFVELKKAKIGNGTKIAHLSYLGDIEVGERCNIGGGVIVVNYDGKKKYKTTVGDDSFVGCNVNLISPVHLGDDTYVSAGSTITDDVPDEALAIARARQVNKEEWVRRRREKGLL